jgi:hypothetical protein
VSVWLVGAFANMSLNATYLLRFAPVVDEDHANDAFAMKVMLVVVCATVVGVGRMVARANERVRLAWQCGVVLASLVTLAGLWPYGGREGGAAFQQQTILHLLAAAFAVLVALLPLSIWRLVVQLRVMDDGRDSGHGARPPDGDAAGARRR